LLSAGITNLISNSYTNGASGKLTLADINRIYFGVNRFYRAEGGLAR